LYSESIYSATITQTTKCNAPTNLTVAETSTNSIRITWTAPSSGAGKGTIYGYCTSGNTADLNYADWKYHSDSSTGFTLTDLTPGTRYYIGVADWLDSGTDMTHVKGTNTNIRTASAVAWITVYTKPESTSFSLSRSSSSSGGTITVTINKPTSGNYTGALVFYKLYNDTYWNPSEVQYFGFNTYTSADTITVSKNVDSGATYRVWVLPYSGSWSTSYIDAVKLLGASPNPGSFNFSTYVSGQNVTVR
jgi:hypothetical protein